MSKNSSSKPVRQDYIAKVRYINTLPPPPLNPKYIQYNTTEKVSTKDESQNILSSLFRKQNFVNFIENVDEEFGLNLNLINNVGVLNNGDESSIFGGNNKVELHAKDKILLRDAGIGNISKSEPGVSFLRRTEYISEIKAPTSSSGSAASATNTIQSSSAGSNVDLYDADAQLKAVEKTFDQAQDSLDNFENMKHPRKRNAKAVAAWPLLPDTSMLDTKFLSIKFTGSASYSKDLEILKRTQRNKFDAAYERKSLETAIFKPITSADGEWMSMYQCKESSKRVNELKEKLNSTEREQPVTLLDEDDSEEFKYKHTKNFDMNFQRFSKPYEELSIKFVPDSESSGNKKRKLAYYYPVSGRIELKKHRQSTNTEINRFLKDSTSDVINFKLREPNTDEMKLMDNLRSSFDPMEYEAAEEEEEVEADVEE